MFARPGKFIWSYEKPYAQILQADGDKLYVYDKDLNQVTVRSLGGALGASPAAILFGSNDLDKNFTLRDAGVKGGIDWLELTPKAKDTQFQTVGIGFKDGNLQAMELHDVFGNVTLLTFSNIQKNPPLKSRYLQVHRAEGRGRDQRLTWRFTHHRVRGVHVLDKRLHDLVSSIAALARDHLERDAVAHLRRVQRREQALLHIRRGEVLGQITEMPPR